MIRNWNSLDSVRGTHGFLEAMALVFFAALVALDILAHFSNNERRRNILSGTGLLCFAIAVLAEIVAYPYSQRNDTLSSGQVQAQKEQIAKLDNSTQTLRTDAEIAHREAKRFEAQVAESAARIKDAEAQAALAHLQIAEAKRAAAEADERAQEASLELAKLKTPRSISTAQKERIKANLKAFSGISFDLYVNDDPESVSLMNELDALLRGSGWNWKMANVGIAWGNKAGLVTRSGIFIEISPEDRRELEAPAIAPRNVLLSEGIKATAEANSTPAQNRGAIHVEVGSKPQD